MLEEYYKNLLDDSLISKEMLENIMKKINTGEEILVQEKNIYDLFQLD